MKKFNFFQKLFHKFLSFLFLFKSSFIYLEDFLIKKSLLRKSNKNFLYKFIKNNEDYLPQSSLQIATLILSRNRLLKDPFGANRIKPKRWIMLNNGIQAEIKKYNIKPESCLSFGGGIINPYSLPILWYLCGSKKIDIIEPGNLDQISAVTGINELISTILLTDNKKKMNLNKYNLDKRLSNIIDKQASLNQLEVNKIINQDIIKLYKKRIGEFKFKTNNYDLIYSRSTLEHIADIDKVLLSLYNIQNPSGIAYHDIDFKGHNISDMFWIYYDDWENTPDNLNGLNGWRLSDYLNFYKNIGAKVIIQAKTIERDYDLRRKKIHPRFENYDDKDLLTSFA